MQTFVLLLIFSYFLGSLPFEPVIRGWFAERGRHRAGLVLAALAELLKGIFAVSLGRFVVGTQVAMALAAIGVIGGHVWPAFRGLRGTDGLAGKGFLAASGTLLFIAPVVLLPSGALWLGAYGWRRSALFSTLLAAVALPVSMVYFRRPDINVVLAVMVGGFLLYQYLSEIERLLGMDDGEDETAGGGDADVAAAAPRGCSRPPSSPYVAERRMRQVRRVKGLLRRLAFFALIAAVITFFYLTRYVYRGFGLQVEVFREGIIAIPEVKVVALTFDDGPHPVYTPLILDALKQYGVRATFFMVGRHVELYPEVARRVVAEGHEVGNHTYSHRNLWGASRERIAEEVKEAERVIEAVTGQRPGLFRPPRGLYTARLMQVLKENRYTLALWSLSSMDWAEVSSQDIARLVTGRVQSGDVVLFHDSGDLFGRKGGNRMNTVRALPPLIEALKAEGYSFVTVTEMMIISGLAGAE